MAAYLSALAEPLATSESLAVSLLLAPVAFVAAQVAEPRARAALAHAALVSALAFAATLLLVPAVAPAFARKGLKGRDLGRRGTAREALEVPSALGLVAGLVFLVATIVSMLPIDAGRAAELRDYNAALLSVSFMVLLGFADDVLDLPWRVKLVLPLVASLPLLFNYHASAAAACAADPRVCGDATTVGVPGPLRALLVAAADAGAGAGAGGGASARLTALGALLQRALGDPAAVDAARGAFVNLGALYFVCE